MIVDDIEDDLDPGAMQRFDHIAKFVERAERIRSRAVSRMRRKKRQRLVAPVITEPGRTVLLVERKYRQQLHRADTEILQIGDLFDQSGVGAAFFRTDA